MLYCICGHGALAHLAEVVSRVPTVIVTRCNIEGCRCLDFEPESEAARLRRLGEAVAPRLWPEGV